MIIFLAMILVRLIKFKYYCYRVQRERLDKIRRMPIDDLEKLKIIDRVYLVEIYQEKCGEFLNWEFALQNY